MPDQHRKFFAEQPFMVFGGVDAHGQPWATVRAGMRGFVSSPDAQTLRIEGGALPGDPLADSWQKGSMIGGLGLQPQTRRRNRINGMVTSADGAALTLEVRQSFGNCNKYIQSRTPTRVQQSTSEPSMPPEIATQLSDADRAFWCGRIRFSSRARILRRTRILHAASTFRIAAAHRALCVWTMSTR